MDPAAASVLEVLEGALLDRVVERTRALDPNPQLDEETTRQFVHGFLVVVREAAEGTGRDVRDLYNAAAVDVSLQQGRTAASIAASLARFGVVLGDELGRELPPAKAVAGADWVAVFLGEWTEEIVAAMEAET